MAAHDHVVGDGDRYFVIDPQTRIVTYQGTPGEMLMQYDHGSERFTFKCPRNIDGHDMTKCDRIEIHFANKSSAKTGESADVYYVDDVSILDDEYIAFSWLIKNTATLYAGVLEFVIRFICVDDESKITYAWHTAICGGKWVGPGMNNNASIDEEYIATKIIEENGTYDIGEYDKIIVDVSAKEKQSELTVKENGTYEAPAGETYKKVVVNVAGELLDEYDGTVVIS